MLPPLFFVSVPVLPYNLGALVDEARRAVGMKHETLAHYMGISSQQLSKQLANVEHLSWHRVAYGLMRMEADDRRAFARLLWPAWQRAMGIEDESTEEAEASGLIALLVRKRMAKAELQQAERKVGTR
jgi:hypothetical protein